MSEPDCKSKRVRGSWAEDAKRIAAAKGHALVLVDANALRAGWLSING